MIKLKVFLWFKVLLRSIINTLSPHKKINVTKFQRQSSLRCKLEDHSEKTLVFHVEGALLKSQSLFPYFFLVAFEAGWLLRALVLYILYPFICLCSKEIAIKIMVFVCFFGMRKKNLRVDRSVLPKHFLEDVGYEGYNMIGMFQGKVAVTDLPVLMVECFLKDYLGVNTVVGRNLKEAFGYYLGFMEEKINSDDIMVKKGSVIGFSGVGCSFTDQISQNCKDIYSVSASEKRKWSILPREKYPKPLVFHDGRLAFRPTYIATSFMFMWLPFGVILCLMRILTALFLPYRIAYPVFCFLGMRGKGSRIESISKKPKGTIFVCNHRTLLDPIYLSMALMRTVPAVTYSLSRVCELFAPLRTVRLTRDKEKDSKMMKKLLFDGDVVICPEGTTCREPYLLRFSPLFAEVSDDIVPVAINVRVTMFYGTTASGMKLLDPVFFLLNPNPWFTANFLEKLPKSWTCSGGGKSRIEVANYVQKKIGKVLKFESTSLTRKDKYMILAGNEGII